MTAARVLLLLLFIAGFAETLTAKSVFESKNPDRFVCETSTARTLEAVALARHSRLQLTRSALSSFNEAITVDYGNLAVLQDDGTVITQPNRMDLANRSITFAPAGSGSYAVLSQPGLFDPGSGLAAAALLADDDSTPIPLPFAFVFYGISYTAVNLNTDGNLTFNEPDRASTERNLRRIMVGPPRISPLFNDLNPIGSALISVDPMADRIIFTWTNVGEWSSTSPGSFGQNTFQAVLSSDGTIRFNYRSLDAQQAVVGVAPGRAANPATALLDLSSQTVPSTQAGIIAEVFATVQGIDLTRVSEVFYRTHPDVYDGVVVFADFSISLNDAFAYALPIRNNVDGIINTRSGLYDYGNLFGSPQRLSVVVNMGDVARYPEDPRTRFLGTNNSLQILGQEFGHRWLAFADIGDPSLLGRDRSHWSFLFNTAGSVMEGNEIEDLGNGRFRTVAATFRYSPLDQYVMGLRPASEVPPSFVVANPTLPASLPTGFPAFCRDPRELPGCSPFVGLQFSGTRRNVTMDQFISALGPRSPAFEDAPKDFRLAFILVTSRGQAPRPSSLQKLEAFRTEWSLFFAEAVERRGTMNSDLLYVPPQITSVSPSRGSIDGGTLITITGSGFQPDVTVTIGGRAATVVLADVGAILVSAPRSETTGAVSIVVQNPRDGQSVTFERGFTYTLPTVTELRTELGPNESRHVETTGVGFTPQVGYASLEAAAGVAIIRSHTGSEVRSEAAVPAATVGTAFRIYVERSAGISTGLAIVNTSTSPALITAALSSGLQTTIPLPARNQLSRYIHEIFPAMGSSFTGTLSLQSDVSIGLIALRSTTNTRGDFIITEVPISSGATTAARMVFPQIADGQGYVTEIILLNPTSSRISGVIEFSFNVASDRGTGTRFAYDIPAGREWRLLTAGATPDVRTGHGEVIPETGSVAPASMAILKRFTGTLLDFEAGTHAVASLTRGLMFGVRDGMHRSGVAMVGSGDVRLTAYHADGSAAAAAKMIAIGAAGRRAAFLDELIPELNADFEGSVLIEAPSGVSIITLRTTVNASGTFLMTAMPILNLAQPLSSGTSYFPQLADGGGFITEFLLVNPASATATLRFSARRVSRLGFHYSKESSLRPPSRALTRGLGLGVLSPQAFQ
jgi:hypothetical protein